MNQEIAITKIQFDVNKIIQKGEQQIFDIANQKHKDGNTYRNSKVTWIKKWPELTQHIDKSISRFQKTWGFDLKTFEPLQYSNYNEGDYYDWHNDQHESAYGDGLIRKLSFTIFLNDEYEGGDFCFNEHIPSPDSEALRKRGTVIAFLSYNPHCVEPMISGQRKSLVAWHLGPRWR